MEKALGLLAKLLPGICFFKFGGSSNKIDSSAYLEVTSVDKHFKLTILTTLVG